MPAEAEVLRRKAEVWNVQLSVMNTCVYHDITSHFEISKVINKYETWYVSTNVLVWGYPGISQSFWDIKSYQQI